MSTDYSRTDIIKIRDLEPAPDGKPQALYECNVCGDHTVKYVSNASKGIGRCRSCSKLKPLDTLPLRLIEDLGMIYPTENSKRKVRMVSVECPICQGDYSTTAQDVRSGKSTMCKPCALSFSTMSYSQWHEKGKLSVHFDSYKVYIIKLMHKETKESFYKIGKTYTTVKERYSREKSDFPYELEEIFEYSHESGIYISKLERLLLNMYKHKAYLPKEDFCGKYECVSDIDLEQIENTIEGETYE